MAKIAKASVLLGTDAVGLDKGLTEASGKIQKWGKDVEAKNQSMKQSGGGNQSGGALSSLGKFALPATIFAGAIAGAKGLMNMVDELGTKLRELRRSASDVGGDLQGFSALTAAAKVAGVSADSLKKGMGNLDSILHASGAESARVFDQLGLKVSDLEKMPLDQRLGKIAAALQNIKDPLQQQNLGWELFKDSYRDIIPLLDRGEKGIKIITDAAKSSGAALNDIDAKEVIAAQQNMAMLSMQWDGLKNSFTKFAVPILDFGIKSMVYGFAAIADVLGMLGSLFVDAMVKPLKYSIDLLAKAQKMMGNTAGAKQLEMFSTGIDNFTADLTLASTGWVEKAHKYFDTIDKAAKETGDKVKKLDIGSVLTESFVKGIKELEATLRDSFARIGKTSAEVKILDLQKQGATPEMLANVKQLAEMSKNAEIAFGNIQMPPLETFERSVKGLDTLFKSGRLSFEQYQQGILKASQTLQSAVGLTDIKTTSGQLAGSRDSVSSIVKANLQDQRQDPQAELKRAFAEAQQVRQAQLQAANKLIDVIQAKKEMGFQVI